MTIEIKKKEKLLLDLGRIEGTLESIISNLQSTLKDVQETYTELYVKWDRKPKEIRKDLVKKEDRICLICKKKECNGSCFR